jgi:hypothetical protein
MTSQVRLSGHFSEESCACPDDGIGVRNVTKGGLKLQTNGERQKNTLWLQAQIGCHGLRPSRYQE